MSDVLADEGSSPQESISPADPPIGIHRARTGTAVMELFCPRFVLYPDTISATNYDTIDLPYPVDLCKSARSED